MKWFVAQAMRRDQERTAAPNTTRAMPLTTDKMMSVPGTWTLRSPANERNTNNKGTSTSSSAPARIKTSESVLRDEPDGVGRAVKLVLLWYKRAYKDNYATDGGVSQSNMIVSQSDVKNRIEQLKLSYDGYSRQLSRPGITEERRDRLEATVNLLKEEMATLETLAQFGRLEPDRDKVEAEVRSRIGVIKERLANDPIIGAMEPEDRDLASGSLRALQWAVGEDRLTLYTEEWARESAPRPDRLERTLPVLLAMTVRESDDPQARANAAYDAGQLHVTEAIPALAEALSDQDADVAEIAFGALCMFSDEDLLQAAVSQDVLDRVADSRSMRDA